MDYRVKGKKPSAKFQSERRTSERRGKGHALTHLPVIFDGIREKKENHLLYTGWGGEGKTQEKELRGLSLYVSTVSCREGENGGGVKLHFYHFHSREERKIGCMRKGVGHHLKPGLLCHGRRFPSKKKNENT